MRYSIVFILISGLFFYAAYISEGVGLLVAANSSVTFFALSIIFFAEKPEWFFKKPDGSLSILSHLMYWPYFLINYLSLLIFRILSREERFHQITKEIYLGCQLFEWDKHKIQRLDIDAVLDLTSEFSEVSFLRDVSSYRCIPLLDTFAPSSDQLKEGVEWLTEQAKTKRVYVHCALGHSRSAVFVAGFLLKQGIASSAEDAVRLIRQRRKDVRINPMQHKALKAFEQLCK